MSSPLLRFGVFTLNLDTNELDKRGTQVKLQEQPVQLLRYLLERPGQLVTRDELREHLWPDTFVDFDTALNTAVGRIRRALGDAAENPVFIETLPKRGYRFIAPVQIVGAPEQAAPPSVEAAVPPVELPASSHDSAPMPATPERSTRTRWLIAVAALLLVTGGVGLWMTRSAPHARVDSIAVLPFTNVGGDAKLEYLTDGLADSLIESLSQLPSLRVMAPGTTLAFKGRTVDPRQVGRDLKVSAVVQGNREVRRSLDRRRELD